MEDIPGKIDALISWANDIKAYVLRAVLGGKEGSAWKLVAGRSNRKYANEDAVVQVVKKAGVFADAKDTARVDSRFVAQFFEKYHRHVLRDIEKITGSNSGLSDEFARLNFELSSYRNLQNKKQPCYMMTREGFTMLVMGYTGKKTMKFKELYIKRFKEMEQFIKTLVTARKKILLLTENIKLLHENPKPYHFSMSAT